MYGQGGSASLSNKGKQKQNTFCDDSDSDSDHDGISNTPTTTEAPWQREFNRYLRGEDELPENMTLIQWWGVSGHNDSFRFREINSLLVKCPTTSCLGVSCI